MVQVVYIFAITAPFEYAEFQSIVCIGHKQHRHAPKTGVGNEKYLDYFPTRAVTIVDYTHIFSLRMGMNYLFCDHSLIV